MVSRFYCPLTDYLTTKRQRKKNSKTDRNTLNWQVLILQSEHGIRLILLHSKIEI